MEMAANLDHEEESEKYSRRGQGQGGPWVVSAGLPAAWPPEIPGKVAKTQKIGCQIPRAELRNAILSDSNADFGNPPIMLFCIIAGFRRLIAPLETKAAEVKLVRFPHASA